MSSGSNTVPLATVRKNLGELVAKAAYGSQRIVITKNGKSVAALVPLEDYDVLVELAKTVGLREARLALKEATQEGTIPLEEVEKRLFG